MPIKIVKDYSIKQKATLMKNFSKNMNIIRKLLARKFDGAKIEKIITQMNEEFENLIPKIPYIGGAKNIFTKTIIQDVSNLAICWILEREGFSYREIGEFFYEVIDDRHRLRKESAKKIGRDPAQYPFEKAYINNTKSFAEHSQKRAYPYDFVIDFIEGDGISFEYGVDVSECGSYKIFKELGAEKYVPLQCMDRILEADIFGFGLFRTQTLAIGAPTCNYRYTKKLKAPHKITEEEVTILKEKKICLVCKGNIEGFNNYICPKCEVLYCENCARTLSKIENVCWVCNEVIDESKPSKSFKREEYETPIKKDSQKK